MKSAVLKSYELTEEGFRIEVRQSRPDKGENVRQYVARIKRYFDRWTDFAMEEKKFQPLADLIIREQFMKSCSNDLTIF